MKMKTFIHSRTTRILPCLATLVASLAFLAVPAKAVVIYAQNFGYDGAPGSRIPFSDLGWSGLASSAIGGNVVDNLHPYYAGIYSYTGNPTNLSNVNAPLSASDTNGEILLRNEDGLRVTALIYTNQYEIDQSVWHVDSIAWHSASTLGENNLDSTRIALRIGAIWYVSDSRNASLLTDNDPANFNTSSTQRSITADSANWYVLTADMGSPFAINGTPTTLPGGAISAFGFYAIPDIDGTHDNGNALMLDSFVINATAIPEPGSLVLIALGSILLAGRLRCNRRTGSE